MKKRATPLSETFRPTTCRDCHAVVLVGIADGLTTYLDPASIDLATEIHALRQRRLTFALTPDLAAVYRSTTEIAAGTTHPVHADHRCHDPLPDTGPAHVPVIQRPTAPDTDEPRF